MKLFASQYEVLEWAYGSDKLYTDPFNDVELDVVLQHETGKSCRVPAYWAGGQEWRVRFAPPLAGRYHVTAEFSDQEHGGSKGQKNELWVTSQTAEPGKLWIGAVRPSTDRRKLVYADGSPFFWLGDTWWMSLCKRLGWPDDFQQLAADRKSRSFSVIQVVAGLYPDMPAFDPRGANEAGFPWEEGWTKINPAYFDMADLRIRWLVKTGLVPCIVGAWGYYLPLLGIQKMKQHWRNLVARWSAYPVFWCLAGEGRMPYYLSAHPQQDEKDQAAGWTEVARYLRQIDPYQRLVMIHPSVSFPGRDQILDDSLIDVNMLQTGHEGFRSIPFQVEKLVQEYQRQPAMPLLVGEANYEGIIHGTGADMQRLTFWSAVLSGACGHTYGANGLWQVNTPEQPYGASPWGGTWGGPSWQDAARKPGGEQVGLAKMLLERYDWSRFEPHPEWIDPHASPQNVNLPFVAGIPGEVRVIYFYWPTFQKPSPQYRVTCLESGIHYRAFFWDPSTGQEYHLGEAEPDANGSWWIPIQPELKDWVVVLEAVKAK